MDLLFGLKGADGIILILAAQLMHTLVDYLSCRVGISLLTNVLVFALPRDEAMRFFGLVSALLLPDFCQSIIPVFNIHWVLRHTVIFLLLRASANHQIIFDPVLHVEELFFKQVIIHQVLDRYFMPFVEKRTHVFRNLLPVKSFYKGKVLGVLNAIF